MAKITNREDKGQKPTSDKKTRRKTQPGNLVVKLPVNPTWLKQPNIVTLMSHDFKLLDIRVMITVIEKLQKPIEDSINGIAPEQISLFQENINNSIAIEIPYKDLGIEHYQYPELRKALLQLVTLPVEIDSKDPRSGEDSWKLQGLMKAYIPKKHSRSFTIEIEKDVAKKLVSVDKGFAKFIKEIAFQSQSKYTVRIYMLISSWKESGFFSITLSRFRKWLQIENKYLNFKDMEKRVLAPAYRELFEKADCWFEYKPIYLPGEKKEPHRIDFTIIRALSESEHELMNKQKENISNLCSLHFGLSNDQISSIIKCVTYGNFKEVLTKLTYLHEYISKNYKSIANVSEYTYTSIMKLFSTDEEQEQRLVN